MSLLRFFMILFVIGVSLLYSLPNVLYPKKPSVIIEGNGGFQYKLEKEGYGDAVVKNIKGETYIILETEEEQEKAFKELAKNSDVLVKKGLYETTPEFLRSIGATNISLGLDLQGGVHFLMEVDLDTLKEETLLRYVDNFKEASVEGESIVVKSKEKEYYNEVFSWSENNEGYKIGKLNQNYIKGLKDFAVEQNIQILRNRVNELGVSEPIIQKEGQDRIVVQLPGVQDTKKAKDIIGSTATLEFRIVNVNGDPKNLKDNEEKYKDRLSRQDIVVFKEPTIKGENIVDASSGFDSQNGLPVVVVNLNNTAGEQMRNITSKYLNEPMAELYVETTYNTIEENGISVKKKNISKEIIHTARIAGVFANRFQISGLESPKEAQKLAILLKSGALVAPIDIIEERTIGPLLGKSNIEKGINSIILGFILVLVVMILRYKIFGLIANVALIFNIVMIFSLLTLFQATLTLPGFAGILLTVGMAVDANVLIFERIKEEFLKENKINKAIKQGYSKAFSTILDANVTTLLAAIMLFAFGTGAIKGFAITLCMGIICSMFTAIIVSRFLMELIYRNKEIKKVF